MDINQAEEAAKALELGKKALDAGHLEKAVKWLEKSLRMKKTAEAETLLACAQKGLARKEAKENPERVTPPSAKDERPFTPEQEECCKKVLSAKSHYESLSIERTANTEEIKRSYRKLALRLHPDKCSAPGADEAFKKVSRAFKILSDPDERAHYDRYGEADNSIGGAAGVHNPFRHNDFQEMDAEDIFRFFMSGQVPGGARFHHFGGRRHNVYYQQQDINGGIAFQQIYSSLFSFMFDFLEFKLYKKKQNPTKKNNHIIIW